MGSNLFGKTKINALLTKYQQISTKIIMARGLLRDYGQFSFIQKPDIMKNSRPILTGQSFVAISCLIACFFLWGYQLDNSTVDESHYLPYQEIEHLIQQDDVKEAAKSVEELLSHQQLDLGLHALRCFNQRLQPHQWFQHDRDLMIALGTLNDLKYARRQGQISETEFTRLKLEIHLASNCMFQQLWQNSSHFTSQKVSCQKSIRSSMEQIREFLERD